jgi:hypothetical protein
VLASISSARSARLLRYRRNLLNLLQRGVGCLLHLAHRLCRTRHLLRNRLHRLDNRAQALRHFGGDLRALLHGVEALLHRLHGLLGLGQHLLDDGLDFARGVRAALGKTAHLFGNDRKPASRLARARRFNRGVQGKQVRLTGNLLNRLQNPADGGGHLREFLQFLRDLAGLLVYGDIAWVWCRWALVFFSPHPQPLSHAVGEGCRGARRCALFPPKDGGSCAFRVVSAMR